MTTYAWPNTRQFVPQLAELRVVDNLQRLHESPLSGYTQTQSMPGARWGWGYTFPDQESADRQAMEAYLLRLSGREHRVQLWDHKRPRPRGSIALSGVTLGAAAAQFATSLVLAGCVGSNRILNGSFEVDTDANGLADRWARYSSGTVGALSQSRSTGIVWGGSYSQNLVADSLGATSSDRQGITAAVIGASALAGVAVTISSRVLGTAGTQYSLEVYWRDGGGTIIGSIISAPLTLTGVEQAISAAGACPAGTASADLYAYQHSASAGAVGLYVDLVRVEAGAAVGTGGESTLLAGDWLGLATGQLVRVVADATATDAGAMTVEVRHMLRQAATSGSAVTLDRPTALYMRAEAGLTMPRQPGPAEPGLSVDFVEAFA